MSASDPYPSRIGADPQVLPRKDPVVHAGERKRLDGPLSSDALGDYERRGFCVFDALLGPDEVDSLAFEARQLARVRRDDASPKVIREPGDDEVRSIFEVHEDEELFRAVVRSPRVIALVDQLLGAPAYVHQSRINFKPAFRGRPFFWHSDFETWHVEDGMPRMRAFSLSINLTENRPDNGPLMLIPESHRYYISCAGRTPEAHYERSLRRQEAGLPADSLLEAMVLDHGLETPTGGPGSAVLFDCNTMHGSNGNITPFPRINLFVVFNRLDNALSPPYSGQPPRPTHIASRSPTPLS